MQMLADDVGIGKPTLYHYFKSKSEILYAIHQEVMSNVLAAHAMRVEEKLAPDAILRGIATDMLIFIKDHPGYVRAFFEHFDELDENHQQEIRAQRNTYLQETVAAIKAGVASGMFRKCDPNITALAFLGMINWTYKWWPINAKRMSVATMSDSLCDLFLNGLKA